MGRKVGAADRRAFCRFAGGNASLYPACVSHSIESRASFSRLDQSETGSVSKEGGVREVQQRGRGQRGAATSSLLPSRHQDHQIHAFCHCAAHPPLLPELWSPAVQPVPDRALGPSLGRHPYLSDQCRRLCLGRSPALPGCM